MHTEVTAIKVMLLAAPVLATSSLAVSAQPAPPRKTSPTGQPAALPAAQPSSPANLAGQDATYLTRQLEAFREGTHVHEQMPVIAKTLCDTQIADVAAYYNAVQIEVIKVPGQ